MKEIKSTWCGKELITQIGVNEKCKDIDLKPIAAKLGTKKSVFTHCPEMVPIIKDGKEYGRPCCYYRYHGTELSFKTLVAQTEEFVKGEYLGPKDLDNVVASDACMELHCKPIPFKRDGWLIHSLMDHNCALSRDEVEDDERKDRVIQYKPILPDGREFIKKEFVVSSRSFKEWWNSTLAASMGTDVLSDLNKKDIDLFVSLARKHNFQWIDDSLAKSVLNTRPIKEYKNQLAFKFDANVYWVCGPFGSGKTYSTLNKFLTHKRIDYTAPSKEMCEKAGRDFGINQKTFQFRTHGITGSNFLMIDEVFAFPMERLYLLASRYQGLLLTGDWSRADQCSKQLEVLSEHGTAIKWDDSMEDCTYWLNGVMRCSKEWAGKMLETFYMNDVRKYKWCGLNENRVTKVQVVTVANKRECAAKVSRYAKPDATIIVLKKDHLFEGAITHKQAQGFSSKVVCLFVEGKFRPSPHTCVALTRVEEHLIIFATDPQSWQEFICPKNDIVPIPRIKDEKLECYSINEPLDTAGNMANLIIDWEKTNHPLLLKKVLENGKDLTRKKYQSIAKIVKNQVREDFSFFELTSDKCRLIEAFSGVAIKSDGVNKAGAKDSYRYPKHWQESTDIRYKPMDFKKLLAGYDKDKPIVICCDTPTFSNNEMIKARGDKSRDSWCMVTAQSFNFLVKLLKKQVPDYHIYLLLKYIDRFDNREEIELSTMKVKTNGRDQIKINLFPIKGNWFEWYYLVDAFDKESSFKEIPIFSEHTEVSTPLLNAYKQKLNVDLLMNFNCIPAVQDLVKRLPLICGEIWLVDSVFMFVQTKHPLFVLLTDEEKRAAVNKPAHSFQLISTVHDHYDCEHGANLSKEDEWIAETGPYMDIVHYIIDDQKLIHPYVYRSTCIGDEVKLSMKKLEFDTQTFKVGSLQVIKYLDLGVRSLDFAHPQEQFFALESRANELKGTNLQINSTVLSREPKAMYEKLYDFGNDELVPIRYAQSENNAYTSCNVRFLEPKPHMSFAGAMFLLFVSNNVAKLYPELPIISKKTWSFWDWIKHFPSNRAKKFIRFRYKTGQDMLNSLNKWKLKNGLGIEDLVFCARKYKIKIFRGWMKDIYSATNKVIFRCMAKHDEYKSGQVQDKGPRPVQMPHESYLAFTGPYFKTLSELFKEYWDGTKTYIILGSKLTPWYTSGANAEKLGKWFDRFSSWICLDVSGMDAGVTHWHVQLANSLFTHVIRNWKFDILTHLTDIKFIRNRTFKITVGGKTCSGDSKTSAQNSVITDSYVRVASMILGIDSTYAFIGDDNAINSSDNVKLMEAIKTLATSTGFVMKGGIKSNLEMDYNSQVIYPTLDGPVMGPRIVRGAKRFVFSLDSPFGKNHDVHNYIRQWVKAESLSLNFVPILRDALWELTSKHGMDSNLRSWMSRRMANRLAPVQNHVLDENRWRLYSCARYSGLVLNLKDLPLVLFNEVEMDRSDQETDKWGYPSISGVWKYAL